MKTLARLFVAALLVAAASAPAHAQLLSGFSVEARGGGAFPTGDFADATPGIEAETGPHFAVKAAFHVHPSVALYAGYGASWFGCSRCGERGLDDQVRDAGFDFGVEASGPALAAGVAPWAKVGGVLHELTFSGFESTLSSEQALGFRVGGGIAFPLTASLTLTPGVSYSAYSAELDLGGLPSETVDVTHFTADVGLRYRF